jgi:hypothetical protein
MYMVGAGILPVSIYKNQLYFLFGKENKFEDFAPGWADFGGGQDNQESLLEIAIREGTEETTGFLGSYDDIRKMLKKHGTFNIDVERYRTHIFPMEYDEKLPYYYNNNQRFLQKKLPDNVIKNTKIFEKSEIKWIPASSLKRVKPQFRKFYQRIIESIIDKMPEINRFVLGSDSRSPTRRRTSKKHATRKISAVKR